MRFYIGTYSRRGIFTVELDGDRLRIANAADGLIHPNYLLLRGDALYAVGGGGAGGYCAASFRVCNSELELRSIKPVSGVDPCHLALSLDERTLYTANYGDGSVSAFHVEAGLLSDEFQVTHHQGSGPNAARQERAHAHFVYAAKTDPGAIYAIDLGLDALRVYDTDCDTGALKKRRDLGAIKGGGPRHAAFSPDEDSLYLLHELTSQIRVYKQQSGEYRPVQDISMLPEGYAGQTTAAAIHLSGDKLYASNRGHNSITAYPVLGDGSLGAPAFLPTGGRSPRDFFVLPDGRLLAANQDSSSLTLLSPTGELIDELKIEQCVCIIAADA